MKQPHGTSLETRPSLLNRLKSGDDPEGWQEFYRTYGGLIQFFSTKAGLTADEAEEVVQETAIGVARRLPEFTYDPTVAHSGAVAEAAESGTGILPVRGRRDACPTFGRYREYRDD